MTRVAITGGGTGGHIFPGLELAQALQQQGHEVLWYGDAQRLEGRLVPEHAVDFHSIPAYAIRGRAFGTALLNLVKTFSAVLLARRLLKAHRIERVLGCGGFVSVPVLVAALTLRIPVVLLEQNACMGLANRLFAPWARALVTAWPQIKGRRVHYLGNPVRAMFWQEATKEKEAHESIRILVMGGSLGARSLNQRLPRVLAQLAKTHTLEIVHQSGRDHHTALQKTYDSLALPALTTPFIRYPAEAMHWADIIIARAGAMTVSEIQAMGVASLLVPYPFAQDRHQHHHAQTMQAAGAAYLWDEQEDSDAKALQFLEDMCDFEKRQDMAKKAQAFARPQATEALLRICLDA